ncbi:MAG: response regulator [Lachnospiraceae bacterium]|nr:response regulator [Lachnospiraceae bacterium]
MKVLIVDDEIHAYKAIQMLIDWKSYGVEELLYAADGKEGLKIAMSEQPVIIFTDMQMPAMNGIEYLQKLREAGCRAKIIAVSGYSDFKYVKALIQTNGIDYVLKPISRDELQKAVKKAFLQMEEEKKHEDIEREMLIHSRNAAALKFRRWILEGQTNEREIPEILKVLGMFGKKVNISLFLLCDSVHFLCGRDHLAFDDFESVFHQIAAETCGKQVLYTTILDDRQLLLITCYLEGRNKQSLIRMCTNRMQKEFDCAILSVTEEQIRSCEEIPDSYMNLKRNLLKCEIVNLPGDGLKQKETRAKSDGRRSITERETISMQGAQYLLEKAIAERDDHTIDSIINEIAAGISAKKHLTLEAFQIYTAEMNLIIKRIRAIYGDDENSDMELSAWAFSLESWTRDAKIILHNICTNDDSIVLNIKGIHSYIQNHFSDNFGMADLSNLFGQSPQYISKQFKQSYGISIGAYTKSLRLEHAKSYLRNSNMPVSEIAHLVGYEDEGYFCKIFKGAENISALQYRKANQH